VFNHALVVALNSINLRLARIERALRIVESEEENEMATLADLAAVTGELTATVQRVAADLTTLKAGGGLSAEQQATLDKAVADLTGDQTALTTADPAPATTPPAV
jgi:uncharacterized protein with von Willebrand factor type A (vWA) domain